MRTTEEMVEFCLKYGYGKGMTKNGQLIILT